MPIRTSAESTSVLEEMNLRLRELEHAAELIKTVLIVKEPNSVHSANAFDGLRKQILASSAERRAHLSQLTSMAVSVRRARDVADLFPQVEEWLRQAGVTELWDLPSDVPAQELFEDVGGGSLEGAAVVHVEEPAYLDRQSGVVLRLGRASRVQDVAPKAMATEVSAAEGFVR